MKYVISKLLFDSYAATLGEKRETFVVVNKRKIFKDQLIPATQEKVIDYLNETANILGGIDTLIIEVKNE